MDQAAARPGEMRSQKQPLLRWSLVLLALITLLYHAEANSILALGPILSREFRLSDTQVGVVTNAAVLVIALFAVPLAVYADRRARKPLLVGGMVVWAAVTALRGSASGFPSLVALSALSGIGLASFLAPSSSLLYDLYAPELRSQALGIQGAGQSLGTLLGFVLPGALTLFLNWRLIFVGFAACALVYVIPLLCLREPQRGAFNKSKPLPSTGAATREPGGRVRPILRSRAAQVGILGFGAQSFGVGGIASFLPIFFVRSFATSSANADYLVAGVVCMLVLGALLGGLVDARLRQRYGAGSHAVLAGAATFALGLLFAGALWLPLGFFLSLTLVCGLLLGSTIAPLTVLVGEAVPVAHRSFAYAIQIAVAALCQTGGGLAVGTLSDRLQSLQLAFLVFSCMLAVAGGWMLSQFRVAVEDPTQHVSASRPVRMRRLFALPLRPMLVSSAPATSPTALQKLEPELPSPTLSPDVQPTEKNQRQP